VIVDPKVVEAFTDDHIASRDCGTRLSCDQRVRVGPAPAGLLNFKFAKLSWKRVVRSRSADEP